MRCGAVVGLFLFVVVVEVISASDGRTDDGEQGKVKSVKMNGQTKRARGTETEESHSVSTTWDHKGKERKNCSLV